MFADIFFHSACDLVVSSLHRQWMLFLAPDMKRMTYDDVSWLLKHENDMKTSDARSESNNLDGDIDADLTHDRPKRS